MIPKTSIADYNYNLPDDRIAKYPLDQRDASRLLVYRKGTISQDSFTNIHCYLPEQSLLVFNNTKVIQARLQFNKSTGATIEVLCLEPHTPADYHASLQALHTCSWICLVGNLKRWKNEVLTRAFEHQGTSYTLQAHKEDSNALGVIVRFAWDAPHLHFAQVLEQCGALPIPPYLHRDTEQSDYERYQTVYSKHQGSVAAPTAGLHFTHNVLQQLDAQGITTAELTLHVGAGTFKPVKTPTIEEHQMHAEHFSITLATLQTIEQHLGKVTAVGTTSVRVLESLYWIGAHLLHTGQLIAQVQQWQPYLHQSAYTPQQALQALSNYMQEHNIEVLQGSTQILITPPYRFRIVDILITNFHQPQSTLLLLVSAFVGPVWQQVYEYALNHQFRFLSYGDSSILIP